ncbi:MAG: hypothetical protein V4706_10195 [Pseudomonadota bacterium]
MATDAAHPQDKTGAVTTGTRNHVRCRVAFFEQAGNLDGLIEIAARRIQKYGSRKTAIVVGVPDKLDDFGVITFLDRTFDQHALLMRGNIGGHRGRECSKK